MALDLADYEKKAADSIKAFWGNREKARQKQMEAGVIDQGERAGVTGGKNLDGFASLILDLVHANGLGHASGTIDFSSFFKALASIDYQGPITFESFSSTVVAQGLSNDLAVWRNLWDKGMDLAVHANGYIKAMAQGAGLGVTSRPY